jgi:spore coat protein U-like protein
MRKWLSLSLLGFGLMAAGPSLAASTSANLNVTATVVNACTAADATLAFGTVSPSTGTLVPTTATINVTCTLLTPFTVGLGDGTNYSGGARRMRRGATSDYLTYEIYTDLLLTTRFGDTDSSDRAAGLGLGVLPTPVLLYGTVASGQSVSAGNYTDTVPITVYY